MIWLTWRQFRAQALVTAALLAAAAVVLLITGAHLASQYQASGLSTCQATGHCQRLAGVLDQLYQKEPVPFLFGAGALVMYLTPVLIGMFWGAPLISREIDAGTLRLAWNQSVTSTRWLAVKLAVACAAAMTAAGLLSLLLTWWSGPIFAADRQFDPSTGFTRLLPPYFATSGIVPVGYAAFSFLLGVTAGLVIRRTLAAMAVTLALFVAVQIVMPLWVRPHLISPVRTERVLTAAQVDGLSIGNGGKLTVYTNLAVSDALTLSQTVVRSDGRAITGPVPAACTENSASFLPCQRALGGLGLRQVTIYQPASRYWPLQLLETGLFLTMAAALAAFCFRRVRRRTVS